MSTTSYYWQGGRKIALQAVPDEMILVSHDEADAAHALASASVKPRAMSALGLGLMNVRVRGALDEAMRQLRHTHIAHHVYEHDDGSGTRIIPTDTFFVRFKDGVTQEARSAYLESESLQLVREVDERTLLVRVTAKTGRNAIKTANLAADRAELVEWAEPNLVRRLVRFSPEGSVSSVVVDPLQRLQWHLDAPASGPMLAAGAGIRAPQAWKVTPGRRDVVIAVADDGFDLTHPDFLGDGKIVSPMNIVPTASGITHDDRVWPRPGDYHGTPCAGVAVAERNGLGTTGVAPGCALMPVRFELTLDDDRLLLMFEKISKVADVVSCSWGVGPSNTPMNHAFREGIARLARTGGRRGRGLVFCVAAGNNNCPVKDLDNRHPYQYRNHLGQRVAYAGPIDRWIAAHEDVITVSASTSLKQRSAYSSWGNSISVCAPSDNWDDLGRVQTEGRGITTTDNEGFGPGSDFTPGSRYTSEFGGTSSATPTVAGVAGLVLSANPQLTALEVREILQETADKDLSFISETPINSRGEFDANGFSPWFGHGKVNAERAVRRARQP